jgi:hypothetical protein
MLEPLENLPFGITGVRATETVTKDDYDRVFSPLLQNAHAAGRRVRLLYVFAPEFKGFTVGAGWEDVRLGLKYLRMFERCAVVSDVSWIREGTQLLATMMPCPVKVFGNAEEHEALRWLATPLDGTVAHRLLPDAGVLVVEPTRPLRSEDFDALSLTVDPWIEANGTLRGIVVHTRGFPGWTNLGSFLRHMRFVGDHHRKVARVALAADGALAEIAPSLTDAFVQAELKHFGYDRLEEAVAWASAAGPAT